ncbi:MAG: radical SAM protein [bacterium]|nr:radical SAM protein [bacterium]
MKLRDYLFDVGPRSLYYAATRRGWVQPINPLTLTFSVTAACQSRCKTCNIGSVYLANPKLAQNNLSLEEIEKVFRSLGEIYFFNISGGEPFMRPDLAEIVRLACTHLKPKLIHSPTNAISPKFIGKTTRKILAYMDDLLPPSVPISIKPSIDGVGKMHDYVRGYEGNFKLLERTIDTLLEIRAENPRLHVDLGTVISNLNLRHLDEIEDWVHARGIESYRHEIAEQRAEFHNLGDPITPTAEIYEQLTERFKNKIFGNIHKKAFLTRTTEAVRVVYYDVAVEILKKKKQVTPCYGGISNIHMNYDGEIWPCCVLGGDQSLGHVRDWDYDIQALLRSKQAKDAKRYIADGKCACPLANQWLNNVLLTPRHMLKVLYTLLYRFRKGGAPAEEERPLRVVDPDAVEVNIAGTERRKALVMDKLGTIPREEEVELPRIE